MPLQIIQNDIVQMNVDAIVIEERKQPGTIPYGQSIITKEYNLPCKYIIHTESPIYIDGNHNEQQLLASCYKTALQLTTQYQIQSIAIPLLATSNQSFPKDKALQIALQQIRSFLIEHEIFVYLVILDKDSYVISEKVFTNIQQYIDDNYFEEKQIEGCKERTFFKSLKAPRGRNSIHEMACLPEDIECQCESTVTEIEDLFNHLDASFSETLLKLIDQTGKKDSEIYKKANIDRKLFNKIKNQKNYKPSKPTTIAFAFALELSLDETKEFISRAGYALSHSNKFDIIVEYFLIHQNYDIYSLNEVLFAFDQPLVGN